MKTFAKILSVLAALLLAFLAVVSPAQAALEDHYTEYTDWEFSYDGLCEFPVQVHMYGPTHIHIFVDKDGIYSASEVESRLITEFSYGDKVLRAHSTTWRWHNLDQDGSSWIVRHTGAQFKVVVPGYGPVMGTAGVLVEISDGWETLKDAGPDFFDMEGLAAFCSYLNPDYQP